MTERPNRPESSGLNELRTFEYTSRQLIFAICAFLLLGAGLILLGIQLGQREKYRKLGEQVTKLSSVQNTENDKKENTNQALPSEGKGTQLSPLPAPVSPAKPAASKSENVNAEKPKFVEVPAPSPTSTPTEDANRKIDQIPQKISTGQSVSPQTVSVSPVSDASQASATQLQPGTIASDKSPSSSLAEPVTTASNQVEANKTKPLEPIADVADDRPEDSRQETLRSETNVKEASGKALYAIQIAAIPASKRQEAEEYIKKLKDLNPYIKESEDKKFLRVLVGEFSDKQTAEKKMLELKQKKEFSGCFVRKI